MVQSTPLMYHTVMCTRVNEYCRHWERGDCWFAHAPEQLRCREFALRGVCRKPDCNRLHVAVQGQSEVPAFDGEGRKPDFEDLGVQFVYDLPFYDLPRCLSALVPYDPLKTREAREQCMRVAKDLYKELGDSNKTSLHLLQYVEEAIGRIDLASYALQGVLMQYFRHQYYTDLFRLDVPGLAENRPSVLRGDSIHVYAYNTGRWHKGSVHFVNLDHIIVAMPERRFNCNSRVNVYFTISRFQERVKHRAIENMQAYYLTEQRFCETTTVRCYQHSPQVVQGLQTLNGPQRLVADHVLSPVAARGTALWGPPGTGKTTTVVRVLVSVLDVAMERPRVLVVTPSNEAADLIVERMLKLKPELKTEGRLLRLNALMRVERDVSEAVRSVSTPNGKGGFRIPPVQDIMRYEVVVATMITAGRMYSIGVTPNHFTHVFADEAGHCTEAELLVALQVAPFARRILLAGDHKQLGAMVRAPFCLEQGMNISPLQRIIKVASNNERIYFVMLQHNYRSHPDIVDVVNVQYDEKLLAAGTAKALLRQEAGRRTSVFVDAGFVPITNEHPVVMVTHKCKESREADSPSWMNLREAQMVVSAALNLVRNHRVPPEDIAVLSPYRKQVQKISQILHGRALEDPALQMMDARGKMACRIKVSTVEMYQGRESPVVLLSCVRNQATRDEVESDRRFGLGFLKQPQRANVALSRAQHLMIVFCNVNLLTKDPMWKEYVDRFERTGGVWRAVESGPTNVFCKKWDPNAPENINNDENFFTEDNASAAEKMHAFHEDLPFHRDH